MIIPRRTKAEIESPCCPFYPFYEFYDEMEMEYKSALAEILQVIASALRNGKVCFRPLPQNLWIGSGKK